jgi:perosamine synthetase
LAKIPWLRALAEPEYAKTNWQSFPVYIDKTVSRNQLMQKLLEAGIATRPGIMNSHEEAVYQSMKCKLFKSEEARRRVIILPLYHQMTENDVQFVVGQIKNSKGSS